jgi:hypothetical protein
LTLARTEGEEMGPDDPPEERVIYSERFQGSLLILEAKAFSPVMIVASS